MLQRKGIVGIVLVSALASVAAAAGAPEKAPPKTVAISVTESGFSPAKVTVKKDEAVTLAFKRTTDDTCVTEVVIHVNDKETIEKKLPLNQVVPVTLTFTKTGDLGFACGMNMYQGVISVQ